MRKKKKAVHFVKSNKSVVYNSDDKKNKQTSKQTNKPKKRAFHGISMAEMKEKPLNIMVSKKF